MRFNISDWALLVLASAITSLVDAGAARAIGAQPMPTNTLAFALAVSLILYLLHASATWLILRRCVGNLRIAQWLLASGLGFALGLVASLPAEALLGPRLGRDLLSLSAGPLYILTLWLTVVAVGVATFLPPGLLLQRLSGASAWPFVAVGAASTIITILISPAVMQWLMSDLMMHFARYGSLGVTALVAVVSLASGTFHGLTLGAGLFLMARRPAGLAVEA